ncbi:MAG TPA: hypothetical protein VFL79_14505 [Terriglobia bacterium]|nr:hypothetical protein [Terriglobia bacterium]
MRRLFLLALLPVLLYGVPAAPCAARPAAQDQPGAAPATAPWQSQARLRHLVTKTRGTLVIDERGVEFRPDKGSPRRWSYVEIQSFHLSAHRLDLETYQNRSWHAPGDREIHLRLTNAVPPAVAEQFARRVQKPAKNGRPDPSAFGFASIPARRRTFGGGTNGVLHFRKQGIDYVTTKGRGSRSWRWSDIQTIAHPDPYHFRVQGYRETFEFELKQPMPRKLFDQLWDEVYGRGLTGLEYSEGRQQ